MTNKLGRPKKGIVTERTGTAVMHVVLSEDMIKRVDALRAKCQKITGIPVSQSEVLRTLIERGLDAHPLARQ